MKRLLINIVISFAAASLLLVTIEIVLTLFFPWEYIVPVGDWIPQYGGIAYPNAKIIDEKPGVFRFIYTTNRLRYRGPLIDHNSPQRKIILLGDSGIFGFGVNDDEVVSYKLNQMFENKNTVVINLANGGWSLPQEVRRYIELGQLFKPYAVILHYSSNDLLDYMYGINWVSYADRSGNIRLRDTQIDKSGRWRKGLAPNSFLYNIFFRMQIMMRLKALVKHYIYQEGVNVSVSPDGTTRLINADSKEGAAKKIAPEQVIVMDFYENERRYIDLLRAFANLLRKQGVRFIFISDNEKFEGSVRLYETAKKLEQEGFLEYYSIKKWFTPGVEFARSLQGHSWGKEAHEDLAKHLYQVITSNPRGIKRK